MALNLNGLIPATVLPMDADGAIDEPALRAYIGWVVAQGPVALAINVDTGEGPHLTHDEKVRVLKSSATSPTSRSSPAWPARPPTPPCARPATSGPPGPTRCSCSRSRPTSVEPLDPRVPAAYHEAIAEAGLPMILFQLQPALAGVIFETRDAPGDGLVDGVVAIKEASFDAVRSWTRPACSSSRRARSRS